MTTQSIFRYALSALRLLTLRETAPAVDIPSIPMETINAAAHEFEDSLDDVTKRQLNGRFERGVVLARHNGVSRYSDPYQPYNTRLFKVTSSVIYKPPYLVDLESQSCECPDHGKGYFCKHLIAANIIEIAMRLQAQQDEIDTPIEEEPPAQPKEEEAIIWGVLKLNGQLLGVEVLQISGDQVKVKALPTVIEGGKLRPQFPFEGKRATTTVSKSELSHVKIFQ